jgi:hypothetical protein
MKHKKNNFKYNDNMKQIITTVLLLFFLNGTAQETNYCKIFSEGYNTASEGFPFLRSDIITDNDTNKKFRINLDSLNSNDFKKGSILMKSRLKSEINIDKTYTSWVLNLTSDMISLNNNKWDDIKEPILSKISTYTQKIADQCLIDLQTTGLVVPSEIINSELAACYFFPKQISIPDHANSDKIKEILNEKP